jgi:phosphohistidine phosphatase SixA
MYVGHNPAAADVTEILIGGPVDFPTSAIAIVGLDADWPRLSGDPSGTGKLVASWRPELAEADDRPGPRA